MINKCMFIASKSKCQIKFEVQIKFDRMLKRTKLIKNDV